MSQLILGGALFAVACILATLSVLCFLWMATPGEPPRLDHDERH
jgi:hypothetical protein